MQIELNGDFPDMILVGETKIKTRADLDKLVDRLCGLGEIVWPSDGAEAVSAGASEKDAMMPKSSKSVG